MGIRAVASFLELSNDLGSFFDASPVRQPDRLQFRRWKLTRFPDCPLCGCTVEDCNCDPDEYQAALLAEREAEAKECGR